MKKTVVVSVAALVAIGCVLWALPSVGGRHSKPPSIILIVLDTVRADHLSAYGYDRPTSPHLQRLAAEGALFPNALAPSPWTPPSHASMFTGLLPYEHGCRWGHIYLGEEHATLAERLQEEGYATGAFSANVNISRAAGFAQGFKTFVEVWRDPAYEERIAGAELSNAAALQWLEAVPDGQPFFLFINHIEAHLPYSPPERERLAFYGRDRAEPRGSQDSGLLSKVIAGESELTDEVVAELTDLYDGELLYLDRMVSELTEALAARNLLDDCLLVITSDHGESLGEQGLVDHQLTLADHLLRVPLVMRWEGVIPAGARPRFHVSLESLFHLFLGAARGERRPMEALASPTQEPGLAEYYPPLGLVKECEALGVDPWRLGGLRAIRHEEGGRRLKYVESFAGDGRLYDLDLDPEESRPLAEPALAARLSALLAARLEKLVSHREPWPGIDISAGDRTADDRALRGLGYLRGNGVGADHSFQAGEHRRMGEYLLDRGTLANAAEQLKRACWLEPGNLRARFGLAQALDRLGEPGATDAYRTYLRCAAGVGGEEVRLAVARDRVRALGETREVQEPRVKRER